MTEVEVLRAKVEALEKENKRLNALVDDAFAMHEVGIKNATLTLKNEVRKCVSSELKDYTPEQLYGAIEKADAEGEYAAAMATLFRIRCGLRRLDLL